MTRSRLGRALGHALTLLMLAAPACSEDSPSDEPDIDDAGDDSFDDAGPGSPTTTGDPDSVTWHGHIAPLVASKCRGCHTEDGIAPFSMDSYDETTGWAPLMSAAVEQGMMPPWGAHDTDECEMPGQIKDDLRLSDNERALFRAWSQQGALEGDPENAAVLPDLPEFSIAEPARELVIPAPIEISGSKDRFVCFRIDPQLTADVWITASQVVPGNTSIAHHGLVYLDEDDQSAALVGADGSYDCFGGPRLDSPQMIGVWAPGAVPGALPDRSGMPVKAGSKLVLQMHYHPSGSGVQEDGSTLVQLDFVTEEPDYVARLYLIGNFQEPDLKVAGGDGFGLTSGSEFLIPAGAEAHVETLRYRIKDAPLAQPISLWAVGTHMHYLGTDMLITAQQEGGEQCLIQTPDWDFDWQREYFFDGDIEELPKLYPGDILEMRCTYNNTLKNSAVRRALAEQGLEEPVDVRLGEETLDEMCLGMFGVAVPKAQASSLP